MSKKRLDEYLSRLAEDVSLREVLGNGDVSADNIVTQAAKHGFEFTSEQLQKQVQPLSNDEWADATRRFDGDHSDCYILFLEEAPMSKEALNAFFKKVADDESLQKKLVEFAATQGFEFSADELSDSDLDSAAGGLLSFAAPSTLDYKVEDVTEVKLTDLTANKINDLTDLKNTVFPKVEDLGR